MLSTLTNTDPQQIGPLNLRVMDVDVSTVSTSLDFVVGLWTEKSLSDIFAFDFQAGYDPNLNTNVLKRNVVLFSQFLRPVHSAVIMLSRKALHPDLNGRVFYGANDELLKLVFGNLTNLAKMNPKLFPNEFSGNIPMEEAVSSWLQSSLEFRFLIIKMWEIPCKNILENDIGLIPLAVLCDFSDIITKEENEVEKLVVVTKRIVERIQKEVQSRIEQRSLFTNMTILMGLRFEEEEIEAAWKRTESMLETETPDHKFFVKMGLQHAAKKTRDELYKTRKERDEAIKAKAKDLETQLENQRQLVLKLGIAKFGNPSESIRVKIEKIRDIATLNSYLEKIIEADSWEKMTRKK